MFSDRGWILKVGAALGLLAWLCLDARRRTAAEHPDVERAGGFVLVYVLTIGLVALHEVAWRAPEAAPAAQTDLNRLRHDITGELTALSSTHALSSDVLD